MFSITPGTFYALKEDSKNSVACWTSLFSHHFFNIRSSSTITSQQRVGISLEIYRAYTGGFDRRSIKSLLLLPMNEREYKRGGLRVEKSIGIVMVRDIFCFLRLHKILEWCFYYCYKNALSFKLRVV